MSETTSGSQSQHQEICLADTGTVSLEAIVQSGTSQSLSLLSITSKKPWILDSGATDHLSGTSENFISYHLCAGNEKIRIADRTLALVAGKGHVSPYDGSILQNILHVPKISYNPLSGSKITRDLNCRVAFSPDDILFKA